MSRKIRFLCICGIIAFGLLAPGFAVAQEAPATEVVKSQQSPPPDLSISQDEKPMTLEELKKAVGPHNVCGAPCGFGLPNCYFSCGDAATCRHGYCIFL